MMIDEEELLPRRQPPKPKDLTLLGIAELEEYIARLEGEIARCRDAVGMDLKELVAASKGPRDRVDHSHAPRIDSELRQLLINACHPALRVEVPGKAPNRIEGDHECSQWQAEPQQKQ